MKGYRICVQEKCRYSGTTETIIQSKYAFVNSLVTFMEKMLHIFLKIRG